MVQLPTSTDGARVLLTVRSLKEVIAMLASVSNSREILSLLTEQAERPANGPVRIELWDGRTVVCENLPAGWKADGTPIVVGTDVEALNRHIESLLVSGTMFVAVWFRRDIRMFRLHLDS